MENDVKQIGLRIREMRTVMGKTPEEMAAVNSQTVEEYLAYENGETDFSVTFVHRCAKFLGVGLTDLLSGETATLSSYTICRSGEGIPLERRVGFAYEHLAPRFKGRMTDPFLVTAKYNPAEQNAPIALSKHEGEEFDYILEGSLKVSIAGRTDVLHAGDAIYYNSREEHGMIAVGGTDCKFIAMVIDPSNRALKAEDVPVEMEVSRSLSVNNPADELIADFIDRKEDENGRLLDIQFKNTDKFNFTRDIVDRMAAKAPDRMAMLYVDKNHVERRFTFDEISRETARTANYFASLGIKKGDRVMLVLKRHYQFWFSILALQRMGAIAVPASNQLMKKDFEYRFDTAGIKALVCTSDGTVADEADLAVPNCPQVEHRIIVGEPREGWRNFNEEYKTFPDTFTPAVESEGSDPVLMFFSSGTTGYPKIVMHAHTYALGHYITAKYWHNVNPDGLHFTISDTGWGKALWGKLYGQWMCGCAVFVYDFDRFQADDILPMFKKYNVTTFCAPPTMYRFFIKEDLSKYDLSSLQYATTAGEALNPEVFTQFKRATGLSIYEGFGQTETTCALGTLFGDEIKPGAMGKPIPDYGIDLVDPEGHSVPAGEHGEIVVRTPRSNPHPGIFVGYYKDEEKTAEAWRHGCYHTGDLAWKDEDGYYHYVGRADDVIKSSGYRIGPFEIENVIMELPYVVECGVSAAPDPVRGQVVKATIKLVKGKEGTEELKKEIQDYVKTHTAPYKYPRIVVFRDELPKTVSGKIQRNKL